MPPLPQYRQIHSTFYIRIINEMFETVLFEKSTKQRYYHRLITIQIEHLMSYLQDLGVFRSQQPWGKRSQAHAISLSCHITRHARTSFWLLRQDYCEQKNPNLEKTTTSVLSVLLLIYGY